VARQTVCTAWRTDTRRRGRASAVGYGAFLSFSSVVPFPRSDFPHLRAGHATVPFYLSTADHL